MLRNLRLLPARIWIPLIAVFVTSLFVLVLSLLQPALPGGPVIGSRNSVVAMSLVSLGLLFIMTRHFVSEAVRQNELRSAAVRQAKELEELVETRTRELSSLSTHLQGFAEKEKSALAHTLHDELGGLLTAAKMDLSWVQSRIDQGAAIQPRLVQLGAVLDEAMDLKRRVVEDLRPSLLEHFGLATALRAYLETVCAKADIGGELVAEDDGERIPRDTAIALFRVAQEGLANIVRHAHAKHVTLHFSSVGPAYELSLADDGDGMDVSDPDFVWSHGLTGMRHRINALGGRFELESSPGRGTIVSASVPKHLHSQAPELHHPA